MQRLITFGSVFALLVIGALYSAATPESSAQELASQYAAKFICGKSEGALAARGQYFTIINVHNPFTKEVKFRKKFALGERSECVGKIFGFFPALLRPDEVMGIDCPDIYKHTGIPEGTFIEGYAVLHSRAELDVVSVITAGDDRVATLHSERVPVRKVPPVAEVCSNLNLSINTGTAPWRITADPIVATSEPRPASLLFAAPSFPTLPPAQWIGPHTNSGTGPASRGSYTYEFEFCLCPGFSNAKLNLDGFADHSARVFLNTTALPPISGTASLTSFTATTGFQVGTNTLKVIVLNELNNITGLNVRGSITATAGACPITPRCEGNPN